jgi:hypothetical protein
LQPSTRRLWCCSWRLDLFRTGKTADAVRIHQSMHGQLVLSPWDLCLLSRKFRQIQFWCDTRMVHCSGAQTKILHFVQNLHIIKTTYFLCHLCSSWYKSNLKQTGKEMYQVFNCGHHGNLRSCGSCTRYYYFQSHSGRCTNRR